VQAAILGDAAPGTPFDIWAAGQPSPASLSFVLWMPSLTLPDQLNFPGIYETVKRVARAAFPQVQQGNADLLDTIAQQKLECRPGRAWTADGEFAFDANQRVDGLHENRSIFLAFERKPETLKLIRTYSATSSHRRPMKAMLLS